MGAIRITRRKAILGTAGLAAAMAARSTAAPAAAPATRTIPSSGEAIPAVGLGTWITFNVGQDPVLRDECAAVMGAFFAGGGRLIDSSPMYGSSQDVVGEGLAGLGNQPVFAADKVWTSGDGAAQIEQSREHWRVPRFDLLQVHNLLAWERQLPLLLEMKQAGRLRYLGITTSEGRRHDLVGEIMRAHPLDFVQITYNPVDREVEERILPLAQDRGIAVLVNRPFQQGWLTRSLEGEALPGWAVEQGATSWAQLILRFILAHPAVTTVIPATSRVDHVRENLAVAALPPLDKAACQRLADHLQDL